MAHPQRAHKDMDPMAPLPGEDTQAQVMLQKNIVPEVTAAEVPAAEVTAAEAIAAVVLVMANRRRQ